MRVLSTKVLARRLGLKLVSAEELSISRQKNGEEWEFFNRQGRKIAADKTIARLRSLAVPPAYVDVRYASDPRAHLQAVGRDDAGRIQYRYHPEWETIREIRKAQHLQNLASALPAIRRTVARNLQEGAGSKQFAAAAIVALVDISGIRAGNEEYRKINRTHGASTLLKSNISLKDGVACLRFRGKGGKKHSIEFRDERLYAALLELMKLSGKRMFQYVQDEKILPVTSREVNAFLRDISDCPISLKDFRTLCGTSEVLYRLSRIEPAETIRARKNQINAAIKAAAEVLGNTPAICRRSYVQPCVLSAFEKGLLVNMPRPTRATSAGAVKVVAKLITVDAPAV